jgi:hypothetical protein
LQILMGLVLPARQAELAGLTLSYGLVGLGLGYWWRKRGLSPRQRAPVRERRFQMGHVLLALFNVAVVAMFLVSSLETFSLMSRVPAALGVLAALKAIAPAGLLAGLAMVWSSRGTAPAFTDTVPATPATPASAPAGRAPSFLGVVAGLIVSSFVLYMATIFTALAFHGSTRIFAGVVLPVMSLMCVLYVAAALSLSSKRSRFATWVAWTPVMGVFVAQVVTWVVGV